MTPAPAAVDVFKVFDVLFALLRWATLETGISSSESSKSESSRTLGRDTFADDDGLGWLLLNPPLKAPVLVGTYEFEVKLFFYCKNKKIINLLFKNKTNI